MEAFNSHKTPENSGGIAYRCMCHMGVQNLKGNVATMRINFFKNLNSIAHRHHALWVHCGVSKTLTTQVPHLQC